MKIFLINLSKIVKIYAKLKIFHHNQDNSFGLQRLQVTYNQELPHAFAGTYHFHVMAFLWQTCQQHQGSNPSDRPQPVIGWGKVGRAVCLSSEAASPQSLSIKTKQTRTQNKSAVNVGISPGQNPKLIPCIHIGLSMRIHSQLKVLGANVLVLVHTNSSGNLTPWLVSVLSTYWGRSTWQTSGITKLFFIVN